MSTVPTFTFHLHELTQEANNVKEVIIAALVKEGAILQEDADRINKEYAVMLAQKSWLGSTIAKLNKDPKSEHFYYHFVKIV